MLSGWKFEGKPEKSFQAVIIAFYIVVLQKMLAVNLRLLGVNNCCKIFCHVEQFTIFALTTDESTSAFFFRGFTGQFAPFFISPPLPLKYGQLEAPGVQVLQYP
jgi:hypothetical protein